MKSYKPSTVRLVAVENHLKHIFIPVRAPFETVSWDFRRPQHNLKQAKYFLVLKSIRPRPKPCKFFTDF
jgi:hypothetical protein